MNDPPHRGYALSAFWILALLTISTSMSCLGNDLDTRFSKGLEFLYENQYEDAESHFLIFAREMSKSDEPEAKHWQAKALFQIGRIDHLYLDQPHRAVSQLRKALKLYSNASFAFDARKEIADIQYDRLMDYRTSALEYERLVHDFSQHAGIDAYQYRVAQSYFLVRDFDQARTEARLLLAKWPDARFAQEARLLIANSYYLQGRFNESIKAHRALLDSNPDVPIRARSLFELGICYQDLGLKQKAEEAFIAALKDHPRPDLVQMQLAALRERIKNEDQAIKPLAYPTEPAVSSNHTKTSSPTKRNKSKKNVDSTQHKAKPKNTNNEKASHMAADKTKPDKNKVSTTKKPETAEARSTEKGKKIDSSPSNPATKPENPKPLPAANTKATVDSKKETK